MIPLYSPTHELTIHQKEDVYRWVQQDRRRREMVGGALFDYDYQMYDAGNPAAFVCHPREWHAYFETPIDQTLRMKGMRLIFVDETGVTPYRWGILGESVFDNGISAINGDIIKCNYKIVWTLPNSRLNIR